MSAPVVCAALRLECRALERGGLTRSAVLVRTGMGPRRARAAARRWGDAAGIVVAGVGGGLHPDVRPGHIVVATEVRGAGTRVPCPSAVLLAAALRRAGLTVHCGPLHTSDRAVHGTARTRLAGTGALAVDMESAPLAATGVPFVAVRSIVDGVGAPLWSPGVLWRGTVALRVLRRAAPVLREWCAALGPREVVPAATPDADLTLTTAPPAPPQSGPARGRVFRVERSEDIDLRWLPGVRRVAVVGPGAFVEDLTAALAGLGAVTVQQDPRWPARSTTPSGR